VKNSTLYCYFTLLFSHAITKETQGAELLVASIILVPFARYSYSVMGLLLHTTIHP
jgi:hypothetical protein